MTVSVSKARVYALLRWPLSVSKARVYAIVIPDSIVAKANQYVVIGPGDGPSTAKKRRSLIVIGD